MVNTMPMNFESTCSVIVENGLFEVFENGKIFRINKHGKRECTITLGRQYYVVTTMVDGKQKHFYVHRLIAKAFVPKLDDRNHINHKDGNKLNNNIDNLEWVTPSENVKHAFKTGLNDPYVNGTPCVFCGNLTRSKSNACLICRPQLINEINKSVTRRKIKDSYSHVDSSTLTEKQKEAVTLRSKGMTLESISQKLGISKQAVDNRLTQAKKKNESSIKKEQTT